MKPPLWEEFEGREFKADDNLDRLYVDLIRTHAELAFLTDYSVTVLWKREGTGGGKEAIGKCKLVSRELRYWCDSDWLIWLAADDVRTLEWGPREIEALLFHELLHCALGGREEDKPAIRHHDFEGFNLEIARYGAWKDDLLEAAHVFGQLGLPGMDR